MEQHGTAWNVFSCSMELHGMCFHAAWSCMDFHAVSMKPWTITTEQKKHAAHMMGPSLKVRPAPFIFLSSNLICDRFRHSEMTQIT
jgi:hypothetical protein